MNKKKPSGRKDILGLKKISKETGIPYSTLWQRSRAGLKGEELIKKKEIQLYYGKNLTYYCKKINQKYPNINISSSQMYRNYIRYWKNVKNKENDWIIRRVLENLNCLEILDE